MTYAVTNPPNKVAQTIAGNSIWHYISTDQDSDVDATGYFTNGSDLGMRVGDVMVVIDSDNTYLQTTHSVITVTAGGAATISGKT